MKTRHSYKILIIFLLGSFISCKSESEKTLAFQIDNEEFDFDNLQRFEENIRFGTKDEIQYGIIETENDEQIKFWFLTHHVSSDMGGTIYEFPDGTKEFYSGYHCCEIQFYENGNLGKKFEDVNEFKSFVTERNGIKP